jgi:lipopolysaccharide/colanic/teichoic acid biosynthesis glycosyltransferase
MECEVPMACIDHDQRPKHHAITMSTNIDSIPITRERTFAATERTMRSRRSRPIHARVVRKRYELAKRIMDVVFSVVALAMLLPVMILCAFAIWIEDGRPIFFYQSRTGKGGNRFRMFKFRTMFKNAEELKKKYAHLNQLQWPDFKIANDPRITRVGRILRKTSLDELPQIVNVLRGEMSLVGPRPTSFAASTYDLPHTERLEVLPGITGLWQISGRSDVDFDERLRLDVEYIERRSIWLDLKILCGTVGAVLRSRGAY